MPFKIPYHQAATSKAFPRSYATSSRRRNGLTSKLTLEHFLQRHRVLALWRDILRCTQKTPASAACREMRDFARTEIIRNKEVTDLTHIRYLVSTGRSQFESVRWYFEQMPSNDC